MDEIILIGCGGHARSCIDVIELNGSYKIAGLIGQEKIKSNQALGYPIIGTDEDLQSIRKKYKFALIAIGQIKSAEVRIRLYEKLIDLEFTLPVIISPNSYISSHSKIGLGTIIMHNVIINANSEIGNNCIINNKVLIEHDTEVGNHCHIATGSILNGNVSIGSECFVGSGVITKQSINIGNRCVIGSGSVIKTNIQSDQIIKS